jgi:hypothetical protein
VARRQRVLDGRQQVAVPALHDAEFAQVAAHARLRGVDTLAVQKIDQLRLPRDRSLPQDAHDGVPAEDLGVEVGGQGRCAPGG